MKTGRIHSTETCGTVDGPGIRYVAFFQGCPLRCLYCHNPDTWDPGGGTLVTVDELVEEVLRYRSYLRASGGGFTASGGEPLLQAEFVAELFHALRREGIHTALDTSGCVPLDRAVPALEETDLVLLDWKAATPAGYRELTGGELVHTLDLAEEADRRGIPLWIRIVQVPGLTGSRAEMEHMADALTRFSHVERVEISPFHKMGEYKWESLGLDYTLSQTPPAHARDVERSKELFRSRGFFAP